MAAAAAREARGEAPNDDRKKKKQEETNTIADDNADVLKSVASAPDHQENKATRNIKPGKSGKGKKPNMTEGSLMAGDDDVEGGGKSFKLRWTPVVWMRWGLFCCSIILQLLLSECRIPYEITNYGLDGRRASEDKP